MSEGERKPYRPYATWFFLAVVAICGLLVLANWLRGKYG